MLWCECAGCQRRKTMGVADEQNNGDHLTVMLLFIAFNDESNCERSFICARSAIRRMPHSIADAVNTGREAAARQELQRPARQPRMHRYSLPAALHRILGRHGADSGYSCDCDRESRGRRWWRGWRTARDIPTCMCMDRTALGMCADTRTARSLT